MDDITASILVACQTTGAVNSISKLKFALLEAAKYAYKFGAESIAVFSDLEETTQKFNVVFSGLGKQSNNVVQDLIDGYGQSELSAKKMLSATGDLLSGFGIAKDQALALAEGAAKLGSDLASFSNYAGGAEGATNALTKAMLGERESLKMLGVVIREDDKAYKDLIKRAMTTGVTIDAIGKTFKVSNEQQAKAVASLAIAYQQSGNAIGDFSRNIDSIANQGRTLENRMVELKSTIGGFLNSFLQMGAVQGKFAGWIKDLTDYIKANAEEWSFQINSFLIGVQHGFKLIWQVANNIMQNVATVLVYTWDVGVQVWKDAPGFFDAVWEDIRQTTINVFEFIGVLFTSEWEMYGKILSSFEKNWYSIFTDLGEIALRSIKSIGVYFKDAITGIIGLASSLGKNFWDLLTGRKSFSDAISGVVDEYTNNLKKMKDNQAQVWDGFEFGKGTKQFAADVAGAVQERYKQIGDAAGKIADNFGKNTSEYLKKNGVKMGDFTSVTAGVDNILDAYDKDMAALRANRGKKEEEQAAKTAKAQEPTFVASFKSLGDAINKVRQTAQGAVMAGSMDAVRLQSRTFGGGSYQDLMMKETKHQTSALDEIARNTRSGKQGAFTTVKLH